MIVDVRPKANLAYTNQPLQTKAVDSICDDGIARDAEGDAHADERLVGCQYAAIAVDVERAVSGIEWPAVVAGETKIVIGAVEAIPRSQWKR